MKDPSFEFNLKTQGYTLRSKGMPAKMALVPVKKTRGRFYTESV